MAAAAAAPLLALPLAEKAVQASVDLTKSVVAQVFDALRTPLLGSERVVVRETKRGSIRTTTKANIPAWAVVAGGIAFLVWTQPRPPSGGGFDWTDPLGIRHALTGV